MYYNNIIINYIIISVHFLHDWNTMSYYSYNCSIGHNTNRGNPYICKEHQNGFMRMDLWTNSGWYMTCSMRGKTQTLSLSLSLVPMLGTASTLGYNNGPIRYHHLNLRHPNIPHHSQVNWNTEDIRSLGRPLHTKATSVHHVGAGALQAIYKWGGHDSPQDMTMACVTKIKINTLNSWSVIIIIQTT